MEDVDSYDPSKVVAGWAHAELVGPSGPVTLESFVAGPGRLRRTDTQRGKDNRCLSAKMSIHSGLEYRRQGFHAFPGAGGHR